MSHTWLMDLLLAWQTHDQIKLPAGVDPETLLQFESKHSVEIPEDLRQFLLATNGMGSRDMTDNEHYSFLPLEEWKPVVGGDIKDPFVYHLFGRFFIFCDFLIGSELYAISLAPGRPHFVICLTWNRQATIRRVANSFQEFVELYRRDQLFQSESIGIHFDPHYSG